MDRKVTSLSTGDWRSDESEFRNFLFRVIGGP